MNSKFLFILAAIVGLFANVTLFAADAAGDAKTRMRGRVGQIDQLKLAEVVGENNRGFLEMRKSDGAGSALVEQENRDRSTVFSDTAAKTGSTAEVVGRSFAKQVAAASRPGVWIQREDGSWVKK
ncbi:MAG: DUF1318 domain-containing protein [Opitutaceae bacterium]|nr:DUF1318 domain-containing protein [Opitutaceae bacterium]